MTVGWGIVGTGTHADNVMAPAIALTKGARLVGVVSRDAERAQEFASRHGAGSGWSRYEDLLASPEVDVVLITTPNAQHYEQVIAAARAGKHVLCDKPLALTSQQAAGAVEACRSAGVKLGIDFQMRHCEAFREARRLIAAGIIGDVIVVQAEVSPGAIPLRGWRTDPSLAGLGAVNNIAIHIYDLLRYILDAEVAEVAAMLNTGRDPALEELAITLFRFDSGALVYVNGNQNIAFGQNDISIYGTAGRIVGRNLTRHLQEGDMQVVTANEDRVIPYSNMDAYVRVVADMTLAVTEGREPLGTGIDGLRSVQLTEAIACSAREGRLVALDTAHQSA
jgi:1,5-anhydro-D-fructose reductase (1,5-anhydro-D-mannitol-forming)